MAELAQAEFGKVDIVVNNAGIQHVAPIEEFPDAKWDAIVAINLSSAFHLIKAVVPGMKARRFGRIINVASAHGLTASPFKSAYVDRQARPDRPVEDGGDRGRRVRHHRRTRSAPAT